MLKAINNIDCSPEFNARNFTGVEYQDAKGEMRPAFCLTRDGFSFLAMGFTGKKAAAWKEKFLEAFNAMEAALRKKLEIPAAPAPQAVPDSQPVSPLFAVGKKLTSRQVEALEGFMRLIANTEKTTEDDVLQELLVAV